MSTVAIIHNPSLRYYPDYATGPRSDIYNAVKDLLQSLCSTPKNPAVAEEDFLHGFIRPGDKVVIKPNFVTNRDRELRLVGDRLECSSTHPSVLQPIIDYVRHALKGNGRISIVDSPIEGSDISDTLSHMGFERFLRVINQPGQVPVEFIDLRDFTMKRHMLLDNYSIGDRSWNIGVLCKRQLPGDPRGYVVVDLAEKSYFGDGFSNHKNLRFHRSHPRIPLPHHTPTRNEYSFSRTVLEADVVISVPKLKTHKKTGVTLGLKSVIGLTNRKWWLPHYQAGVAPQGDEFATKPSRQERTTMYLSRIPLGDHSLILYFPRRANDNSTPEGGSWPGNDTLWRTILDMNLILHYADANGCLHTSRQRRFLTVIDGVLGGEGNGPLRSKPKPSSVLVGSLDPVAADVVATRIMGFDPAQIQYLRQAPPELGSNDEKVIKIVPPELCCLNLDFEPPTGWFDTKTSLR